MAVPTAPTATSLVTDALIMAGIPIPTPSQISHAKDSILERVKNEIWSKVLINGDTRLKTLQKSAISIGIINQRRYSVPTEFSEELTVSILDGDTTGIAQGGASLSITLAATETMSKVDAEGNYILMVSGTSKGQYREILSYDSTTKIAVPAIDWDSGKTPVSGDNYLIINKSYDMKEQHQSDLDSVTNPTVVGRPSYFSKFGDEIYFNKPLDKVYGIRMRFYANLSLVDLTEGSTTLITKIYRNWQAVLEQGIYARKLKELDDNSYRQALQDFERMVENLLLKELPYGGEFAGFEIEE